MPNKLANRPEGPYTLERVEKFENLRELTLPLVLQELESDPESATQEEVLDAEAYTVYNLRALADTAKSDLHDRDLGGLATGLSLAILASSA